LSSPVALSIIIPIHNTWDLVKHLIKRIEIFSSNRKVNLELILIDDNSNYIPENLISKDKTPSLNVIHIFLKANLGVGGARDAGLRASTGDYVWFVDSDDELTSHWYGVAEQTLKKSNSTKPDFFVSDAYLLTISSCLIKKKCFNKSISKKNISVEDLLLNSTASFSEFRATVWQFWFRRVFLLENNIKFGNLRLFEDVAFLCEVLSAAEVCQYTGEVIYVHKRRNTSLTHASSWTAYNCQRYCKDNILSTERIILAIPLDNSSSQNLTKLLICKLCSNLFSLASMLGVNDVDANITNLWRNFIESIKNRIHELHSLHAPLKNILQTSDVEKWLDLFFVFNFINNVKLKPNLPYVIHCYSTFSIAYALYLLDISDSLLGFVDTFNYDFLDSKTNLRVCSSISNFDIKPDKIFIINRRKNICNQIKKYYIDIGFEANSIISLSSNLELDNKMGKFNQ